MSIGPVNWGSFSGEQLEEVMSVLLFQERDKAWRRRPSQGDGGVDVVQPSEGGYEVFQIKKFAESLTAGQKTHIRKSLESVVADSRLDRPVVSWNLVLPLDPTSGDEEWFRALTASAPFKCQWLGKVFWDSEASKHAYVIDYYLRDGKQRIIERTKTLHELLGDPESPVRPVDVVKSLSRLQEELDDSDPHYRYEFSVTRKPPPLSSDPGLVLSVSRGTEDGSAVTIEIFSRYPQAQLDRPVEGSFTIKIKDVENNHDISDDWQAFVDYGRRLELPEGAVEHFQMDAPGGFSIDQAGGQGFLGPREVSLDQPNRIELEILSPSGELLAAATVPVETVTAGEVGIEFVGVESQGVFDFSCTVQTSGDKRGAANFEVRHRPLAGMAAATVAPTLRFLRLFSGPNSLKATIMNGPAKVGTASRTLDERAWPADVTYTEFIEMLASLQPHTAIPVLIPESISRDDWESVESAVQILNGEAVELEGATVEFETSLSEAPLLLNAIASGEPAQAIRPLNVELGGSQIPLGDCLLILENVQVDRTTYMEDRCCIVVSSTVASLRSATGPGQPA